MTTSGASILTLGPAFGRVLAFLVKAEVRACVGVCRSFGDKHSPRTLDYRQNQLPLEKAMGLTGVITANDAHDLILAGRVTVGGVVCTYHHALVGSDEEVRVDGELLPPRQDVVYYLLYKPRKVTSTCKLGPQNRVGPIIIDYVPRFVCGLPKQAPAPLLSTCNR